MKDRIIAKMKEIFHEIPYGIEHTLNVLKNAEEIMENESLSGKMKELISLSAILHDIGAIEAQRKYNSMDGKYQEIEGVPIAKTILFDLNYNHEIIERVCYIISYM